MATEQAPEDSTDGSSIRPVSSLRSHFENMFNGNKSPSTASQNISRQPSPGRPERAEQLEEPKWRNDGRTSLDIPRDGGTGHMYSPSPNGRGFGSLTPTGKNAPVLERPKPRPISMGPLSPPRSPPRVTVQSPNSPPKQSPQVLTPAPKLSFHREIQDSGGSRSGSPQRSGHFRIPSRAATPSIDARNTHLSHSPDPTPSPALDRVVFPPNEMASGAIRSTGPPPPVNRAVKPKIASKPPSLIDNSRKYNLAPEATNEPNGEKVSPFSTPPSSAEGSPGDESGTTSTGPSQPRKPPPKLGASSRDGYFKSINASGIDRSMTVERVSSPKAWGTDTSRPRNSILGFTQKDLPEDRPGLPPRRDTIDFRHRSMRAPQPPPELPMRRSMDIGNRPATIVAETNSRYLPPPRRTNTFIAHSSIPDSELQTASIPLAAPSPRPSIDCRRENVTTSQPTTLIADDSDEADPAFEKPGVALTDYPDSSQANRHPPFFKHTPYEIATKYETKLFAICGEYICTTGYVTRVWNLLTAELLMSLSHGETIKVTALAFRPTKDVEDEGKRLWLGTNTGEIHEIDIPSQSVVYSKGNAHAKKEIIKIYRFASEMWTLDDDGKLHVWPQDDDGAPNLSQTPHSYRVPRGHTCSVHTGSRIWIACGKEIRVFQRTNDTSVFVQPFTRPLTQLNVGEVTAGTTMSSQPDRVYFGHVDGKVTVYSRKDYSCIGLFSVSLYKISALVGVGDYLWAGYHTGMIYVYDTTSQPWKVQKNWKGHENPISGIVVDKTSVWKLDRLQVASLGTDNMLRIWDGMLQDDWLESQMNERDAEYCDFRELSALVMTWNAGASKPTKLQHHPDDKSFFKNLLQAQEPPDILSFGFQELVDLEDKKVTAKSFFKSSKKKADTATQEHMSHQYRAWRDHLVRQLEENMPPTVSYTLLHTANLVGLFTCVFVKSTERSKIREVTGAEVKLGMGGLHGNKGALIVRFILDDSSLCFVNCHLAAGQSHTVSRNNHIATIMEASPFSTRLVSANPDIFVGGGDGSMILDHEICILNGDLNYRIDTMSRDTVINAVKAGNLTKLLERDQLLLSKKKNPTFRLRAFQELPITFPPTYKYDVGTDNYDTSEKRRSPAWCDRLLYRGRGRIKQLDYSRHEVRVSDHRPVSGVFKLRVKTISSKRQKSVRFSCEQNFDEVKDRIANDIKQDYLVNVLGLSNKEAQRLLKPGP